LINRYRGKNKVFSAGTFGFASLYYYIFIRIRPCWGGSRSRRALLWHFGVFRKGEELLITPNFPELDGYCRPFFYALSQIAFEITIKKVFAFKHSKLSLNFYRIFLVTKRCYYPLEQAYRRDEHHIQITPSLPPTLSSFLWNTK
jgi:hypothetical protein